MRRFIAALSVVAAMTIVSVAVVCIVVSSHSRPHTQSLDVRQSSLEPFRPPADSGSTSSFFSSDYEQSFLSYRPHGNPARFSRARLAAPRSLAMGDPGSDLTRALWGVVAGGDDGSTTTSRCQAGRGHGAPPCSERGAGQALRADAQQHMAARGMCMDMCMGTRVVTCTNTFP